MIEGLICGILGLFFGWVWGRAVLFGQISGNIIKMKLIKGGQPPEVYTLHDEIKQWFAKHKLF